MTGFSLKKSRAQAAAALQVTVINNILSRGRPSHYDLDVFLLEVSQMKHLMKIRSPCGTHHLTRWQ